MRISGTSKVHSSTPQWLRLGYVVDSSLLIVFPVVCRGSVFALSLVMQYLVSFLVLQLS